VDSWDRCFNSDSEPQNLLSEVVRETFNIIRQGHIALRSLKGPYNIHCTFLFSCFGKIAKSDYQLRRACPYVSAHGATGLPLNEFLLNFIFDFFFVENLSGRFKFH
jgi:hypothetical protein